MSGNHPTAEVVASRQREAGVELFRLLMACFVVGIHVELLMDVAPVWGYAAVNGVFRIAVPFFFVVSGYFLVRGVRDRTALLRWGGVVAGMYVLWTLVYLPWAAREVHGLAGWGERLVIGYWHLWYLPALLFAGICAWCVRALPAKFQLSLALGIYAAGLLIQYVGNYHLLPQPWDRLLNRTPLYRNFLFAGLPFVLVGQVLALKGVVVTASRAAAWSVAGVMVVICEAIINHRNGVRESFDLLFGCLIAAPALFLLALRSFPESLVSNKLGRISSGVYLLHPLALMLVGIHFAGSPLRYVVVLLLSVLMAVVLLPLARRSRFVM